jgi:hypothetical protein
VRISLPPRKETPATTVYVNVTTIIKRRELQKSNQQQMLIAFATAANQSRKYKHMKRRDLVHFMVLYYIQSFYSALRWLLRAETRSVYNLKKQIL